MSLQFVNANDLRFAYLEEGRGPLVLLLHGFPDTPHTWDAVRPRIAAKGYRVVSPFMRGYRPTAIPPRDADGRTLAEDVLALIGALGEESAIVIGHDWGGFAAYGAAALAPERVRRLITVGLPHPATVAPTPQKAWAVRHFLAYKLPGAAARFAANDFAALPAIYRRWSPTWADLPASELAAVRECFADRASLEAAFGYYRELRFVPAPYFRDKIRVPTIAFAGSDEPAVGPADYHAAKKAFASDYRVEEMPGGHFMHREHPGIFAERLLAHL